LSIPAGSEQSNNEISSISPHLIKNINKISHQIFITKDPETNKNYWKFRTCLIKVPKGFSMATGCDRELICWFKGILMLMMGINEEEVELIKWLLVRGLFDGNWSVNGSVVSVI
jgi:hypothetical protein